MTTSLSSFAQSRAGGRGAATAPVGAPAVPVLLRPGSHAALTPQEAAAVALFIDAGLVAVEQAPVAASVVPPQETAADRQFWEPVVA